MTKTRFSSFKIDYRSKEKIEVQIAHQIKAYILTHRYDHALTQMDDMSHLLEVDQIYIKKAFELLVDERVFEKDEDHNYTIFKHSYVKVGKKSVTSLASGIKILGQKLLINTFDCKELICDGAFSKQSKFEIGDYIYMQKRIYLGDGVPKAYMELYFSLALLPDIKEKQYHQVPYHDIVGFEDQYESPSYRRLKASKFSDQVNLYLDQNKQNHGFFTEEYFFNADQKVLLYAKVYFSLNYDIKLVG